MQKKLYSSPDVLHHCSNMENQIKDGKEWGINSNHRLERNSIVFLYIIYNKYNENKNIYIMRFIYPQQFMSVKKIQQKNINA